MQQATLTANDADTQRTIDSFNAAFNEHDADALFDLMTEDCVFENTSPLPDGQRYEGRSAVDAYWRGFFASSPKAHFETEDMFVAGERAVVRWIYSWGEGHIRGVDVFRVRDGRVAEKLAYVKG